MDEPMNDREQIEAIKSWWRDYGKFTIATFVIVCVASFGWNYLQVKRDRYSQYASMLYEQTQYSLSKEKYRDFQTQADYLAKEFKRAPYAQLANLSLASRLIKENKLQQAQQKLEQVVLNAHDPSIRQIARIREARILLSLKKPDEAIMKLKKIDQPHYAPLIEEVRGDVYVFQEDYVNARKSYQAALKGMAGEQMNRAILQMKYDQISDHYNEVA